ncbi:MAG: RES family NAD+ phosphorylase [Spirochaetales bacterium]|nr:RES family NAD+ phosphorylase [Spirochaetales bacterium]
MSGEGARLYGGRFNPPGSWALYASEYPSLALAESIRNIRLTKPEVPYSLMHIHIPDDCSIMVLDDLGIIQNSAECRAFGTEWLKQGKHVVLKVRSFVVPQEYNFVLNTRHPDFDRIRLVKTEDFSIDPRIR